MDDETKYESESDRINRLLAMGLDKDDTDENIPVELPWDKLLNKPGSRIDRYKLLKVLGEGGMGIVYLAQQQEPIKRMAALKVIKPGMDTKRVIARFEAERQTLALLDHPNIAHIYDAGTTRYGRPYFVMEYVEGMPITDYCDHHKLRIEDRLKLFLQVCQAIHYAHQKGIIHRDIKPSNIVASIKDNRAILKIIDFGIAKAASMSLTDKTLVTESSQLLGTPEYMSPEQADMSNEDIDIRSDIYSLGVVLYELLTGILPFDSQTLRQGGVENIRRIIQETEPKTPSTRLTKLGKDAQKIAENRNTEIYTLTKSLQRELEWIPLKAMRKERLERYRSVAELADDIENYLDGRPLIAVPPTKVYRLRKFILRNKTFVTAAASLIIVLLAGIIISTVFAIKADMARKAEQEQRKLAENALNESEKNLYISRINLACQYYLDDNVVPVRKLLKTCPINLRGWEWYYLWKISDQSIMTLHGHESWIYSAVFSPDGTRIVSGSTDNTIKLWDAESGKELRTFKGHEGWVGTVAFSPDGKRIISGSQDNTIKLWNANSGEELMTLRGHNNGVWAVEYSPDGKKIVSGSLDNTIKLWDAENGSELRTFRGHESWIGSAGFSPDGKRIVSSGLDQTIRIWDVDSGNELMTLKGHKGYVGTVAFGPDGRKIVSGSGDNTIKIWDAENGNELLTLEGHKGPVHSVAFSPDGSRIVSGSDDSTIKLWDAYNGNELMSFKGHENWVRSVAFSPDGKKIVSGSADYTIKLWDTEKVNEETTLLEFEGLMRFIVFSPGSEKLVLGNDDKNVKICDIYNGKELVSLGGRTSSVTSLSFSQDARLVVTGYEDGSIKVWDADNGNELWTKQGHADAVISLSFSHDNKKIVSGSRDKSLKIWDSKDGSELKTLRGHEDWITTVAFSQDDSLAVSGSSYFDGTLKVWDANEGNVLITLKGHEYRIISSIFNLDDSRIISGSQDATLKVWDSKDGSELMALRGHEQGINSIALSPDGSRIISASEDNTLKIWDAESGNELLTIFGQVDGGYFISVAFSANGNTIFAGRTTGKINIYNIPSYEEVEDEILAEEEGHSWFRRY